MVESRRFRASIRRELGLTTSRKALGLGRRLRLGALTALLGGFVGGPALAQGPYHQELLADFSRFDFGFLSTPEVVDLDGDGDLDVVVGSAAGGVRLLENTGAAGSVALVERTGAGNPFAGLALDQRTSPELVDLDGDGDLDAVVGHFLATLIFLENTGTPSSSAFVERTGLANPFGGLDAGYLSRVALADLDGDGDLDAAVGSGQANLRYFENTGSSASPAFAARSGSENPFPSDFFSYTSDPQLADLDGDGDLDLTVGSYDGMFAVLTLHYFENTGTSTAPAFLERFGGSNPFAAVSNPLDAAPDFVDLDGDGDYDTVLGARFGGVRSLRNVGSSQAPVFVELTGIENPFGLDLHLYSAAPELADLDGDGDVDAVVGDSYGELSYFENTGTPQVPSFVARSGALNPFEDTGDGRASRPELADLDGDGDLDAIVGQGLGGAALLGEHRCFERPCVSAAGRGGEPLHGSRSRLCEQPSARRSRRRR
ncbi:MAG: VCBS repeat-containing protein [Thermoanaerobaculia bacterium]|nr:VCBS repeat-containing protein [Thermoanaerobaculia bacterium]